MKTHLRSGGYILLISIVIGAALTAISAGLISYFSSYLREARLSTASAQALAIAEGGIDNALYQLDQNGSYTGETGTALGAGTFTATITSVDSNTKLIKVTGYVPNSTSPTASRTVVAEADVNTSVVSFHYGVQVGNGGITMGNGSVINGGIYSGGGISGGGTITGDATASGNSNLTGVTVNGNATAHTMNNCVVGKNATYNAGSTNCVVSGTQYPNSGNAADVSMPISAQQITDWETIAAAGGTMSGGTLSGTNTLGPIKVNGDLTIGVNAKLTLTGPIWVNGNVTFGNNSTFNIASSVGNEGAILIADATGNTAAKGTIYLANNMIISGNGNAGSYPMALSTNTGASAISMNNNATSIILYAPYGTVSIANGAAANQLTAYQIVMSNNSTLNYVAGLQSQSFSDGPGGSWEVIPGTYAITK